jgi:GDP-L-fucose synthase
MIKLITGGTGLIGSQFKEGHKLNSSDYNLLDEQQVRQMYEDIKPEVVIHTAARVGGLGANIKYLGDFFYENIKMNTNVIHYAKEYGVKKLVCFTSTCVFPDKVEYPLTENKIHLGPPHHTNYAYAHAKRMCDIQIQAYNEQFNTKYFTVIPASVYGPNDNFNLENSHVVPALIHKVYLALQNNEDIHVWGTGKPLREFIFSKDVATVCDLLLEKHTGTDPVIVSRGLGGEVTIEELVTTICDIFKFPNKIIFDSSKPDGQYRKPSSNDRLMTIIGDYRFTPLREGLEETINWFNSTYPNIRR